MSYAVCRMQKVKSAGLKGMQFHNQRERKSRTNDDIDHERTRENYDLKNDKNIDYNERVKEIIESQKTGTRKTRKDAVLVNELLVTSDRDFFEQLDPGEQKRFFEESYKLFSERYGKQNIAYATVHNDEQTPHMHLGVVPMRDGKLQGKNVFNRQELLWLQDKFPEHMKKQGFELKRGERGSDRKHIETAKFKKQTLEKEIDFLEKNLAVKKDEWTAYSDKVKSDLEVPAKRHMKSVEVPTGEKSMFGLGKEIMKTEKKPTKNVVISERDYKNLVTAARDNDRLKQHVRNLMSTDMAREYKKLSKEHGQVKEKYSGLVERFNENVNDYNELLEENKSLKSKISDLKRDVSLIYESTKEFLKERTDGLKAFKNVFKGFVDKVKDKTAQFQEKHDLEVPAKRHMKSVEVPTGEKSMFGLGKEIMKTEKKPTKNVVISERDYKNLVTAARDNDRLKQHVRNLMSTDMAREYKKLSKEHGQVKEKYSGLVERFNENVNDYNELLEENKSLKSKISDLKRDVSLIYESTKEFLKERTDGLKAFKNVFKGFVDKVKDKTAQFQEKHDLEPKKNEFELTHNREVKKERSRDQGMSL